MEEEIKFQSDTKGPAHQLQIIRKVFFFFVVQDYCDQEHM